MGAFRVEHAARVAELGFLAVDDVRVAGPEGERFTRTVVRHPGAVVMVPLDGDGETVLMVRQFRAATGGDLLELPAGKRDVADEPPEATARRELEEELGRRPGRLVRLAEYWNTPGFCDEYSYCFLALDLAPLAAPVATSPEEREMVVEPVRLADVERRIAAREIVDAKSMIGLLLARRYLAGEYGGLAG